MKGKLGHWNLPDEEKRLNAYKIVSEGFVLGVGKADNSTSSKEFRVYNLSDGNVDDITLVSKPLLMSVAFPFVVSLHEQAGSHSLIITNLHTLAKKQCLLWDQVLNKHEVQEVHNIWCTSRTLALSTETKLYLCPLTSASVVGVELPAKNQQLVIAGKKSSKSVFKENHIVLVSKSNREFQIWAIDSGQLCASAIMKDPIVVVTIEGKYVIISTTKELTIWPVGSQNSTEPFAKFLQSYVTSVAMSGNLLVAGDISNCITLYDISKKSVVGNLSHRKSAPSAASPEEGTSGGYFHIAIVDRYVCCANEKSIEIYDIKLQNQSAIEKFKVKGIPQQIFVQKQLLYVLVKLKDIGFQVAVISVTSKNDSTTTVTIPKLEKSDSENSRRLKTDEDISASGENSDTERYVSGRIVRRRPTTTKSTNEDSEEDTRRRKSRSSQDEATLATGADSEDENSFSMKRSPHGKVASSLPGEHRRARDKKGKKEAAMRKHLDTQIKNSSDFVLFDNLVHTTIVINEHSIIEYINPAAIDMMGYDPSELIGQNVKIIISPPEIAKRHDEYVENYIKTGVKKVIGLGRFVSVRTPDGSLVQCHLTVTEHSQTGRKFFIGTLSVGKPDDESGSDTDKSNLNLSEVSWNIFDNLVKTIVVISAEGKISYANKAAEKLLGYNKMEMIGNNVSMLMPAEFAAKHDSFLIRYLSTKQPHVIGIGRDVPIRTKFGAILNGHLEVTEHVADFTGDISFIGTLSVAPEESLETLIDKQKPLLSTLGTPVVIITEEGIVRFFNEPAVQAFGYSANRIIGKNISNIMTKEYAKKHNSFIRNYLKTKKPKVIGRGRVVPVKCADGIVKNCHLTVTAKKGKNFRIFIGVLAVLDGAEEQTLPVKSNKDILKKLLSTDGSDEERTSGIKTFSLPVIDTKITSATHSRKDKKGKKEVQVRRHLDAQIKEINEFSLFDSLVHATIVINERGIIEYLNPAAIELTGYDPSAVIGKNVSVFAPDDIAKVHDQYIKNYMTTGVKKVIGIGRYVSVRHYKGHLIQCHLTVTEHTLTGTRMFVGTLSIGGADDSETSGSASSSSGITFNIFNNLLSATIIINKSGRVIYANPATEKLTGYVTQDLVGRYVTKLMPDDIALKHDGFIQRYLATKEPHVIGKGRDVPIKHANGTIINGHLEVTEHVSQTTGDIYFIGTLSVATQETLAQLLEEQKDVIGGLDVPVIVITEEGTVRVFNRPASKAFGYDPEKIIGKNVSIMMTKEYAKRHNAFIRSHVKTGRARIIGKGRIVPVRCADGSVLNCHLTVTGNNSRNFRIFVGILAVVGQAKAEPEKFISPFGKPDKLSKETEKSTGTSLFRKNKDKKGKKEVSIREHLDVQIKKSSEFILFDSLTNATIVVTEEGIMEYVNPAAVDLTGFSPSQLVGKNVKILMPPEIAAEHDVYIKSYIKTGIKRIIGIGRYVSVKNSSGSLSPCHLTVTEHRFTGRRLFIGTLALAEAGDESESSQQSGSLGTSQQFTIFDHLLNVTIVITSYGRILYANAATEKFTGYSLKEILGQNVSKLMPPEYAMKHDGYLSRYIETRQSKIIGVGRDLPFRRKDGVSVMGHLEITEHVGPDGSIMFIGSLQVSQEDSITNLIAKEVEILGTLDVPVIIISEDGKVRFFNEPAGKTFGYPTEKVIGQNVSMLMPKGHAKKHNEFIRTYIRTGITSIIGRGRVVQILCSDGLDKSCHLTVTEKRQGNTRIFVGIIAVLGGVEESSEAEALEHGLIVKKPDLSSVVPTDPPILSARDSQNDLLSSKVGGPTKREKSVIQEEAMRRHLDVQVKSRAEFVLFDNLVQTTIIISEHGIIEYVNPATLSLTGHEPGHLIGKNIKILMPSAIGKHHDSYLNNYLTTGVKKVIGSGRTVPVKHKDGSETTCVLMVTEHHFTGRRLFIGTLSVCRTDVDPETDDDYKPAVRYSMFDNLLNATIIINSHGKVIYTNYATEKFTGYSNNELVGRNVNKLMPAEIAARHDNYLARYIKTKEARIIGKGRDINIQKKDGEIIKGHLEVTEHVNDNEITFIGTLSVSQESLEALVEKQKEQIGSLLIPVIIISEDGNVRFINKQAVKTFGFTSKKIVGKNVSNLMPKEFAQKHNSYIRSYIRTGVSKIIGVGRVVPVVCANGTTLNCHLTVTVKRYDNFVIFIGILATIGDSSPSAALTEKKVKKKVTKAKKEVQVRHHLDAQIKKRSEFVLFDNLVHTTIVITESGIIQYVNPATLELTGYEPSELIGKNIKLLLPPELAKEHDTYLQNYIKTGVKKVIGIGRKATVIGAKGVQVPCHLTVTEHNFTGTRFFIGTLAKDGGEEDSEDSGGGASLTYSMFENLLKSIIVINSYGKMVYVNPATEKYIGYSTTDLIGSNVSKLMPPNVASRHDSYIAKYLTTKEAKIIGKGRDVPILHRNGDVLLGHLEVTAHFNATTGETSFIGTLSNAEEHTLENMVEQQKDTLAVLEVPTIVISEDGIVQIFNLAAAKAFGYSSDNIVGKNVSILMTMEHAKKHNTYIRNYVRTGKAKVIGKGRVVKVRCSDGSEKECHLTITAKKKLDIQIFIGILAIVGSVGQSQEAATHQMISKKFDADKFSQTTISRSPITQQPQETEQYNKEAQREVNVRKHLDSQIKKTSEFILFDNLIHTTIVINTKSIIEYVNPSALTITGYEPSELLGRNVKMLLLPEEAVKHDGYVQSFVTTGIKKVIGIGRHVTLQTKHGKHVPLHLTVTEHNITGEQLFIGTLSPPVIQQKDTEVSSESVSHSASFAVFDNLMNPTIVITHTGKIVYVNPATGRFVGYSETELIGKNVGKLMPINIAAKHDGYITRYIQTGIPRIIGKGRDVPILHRNGDILLGHLQVTEHKQSTSEDAEPMFIGTLTVSLEDAIEELIAKQQDLLDNLEMPVAVITEDGLVRVFNEYAVKAFGYPANKVVGKNITLLMTSEYAQKHNGFLKSYITTGQAKVIGKGRIVPVKCADGSIKQCHLTVSVKKNGNARIFLGILAVLGGDG